MWAGCQETESPLSAISTLWARLVYESETPAQLNARGFRITLERYSSPDYALNVFATSTTTIKVANAPKIAGTMKTFP